MKAKESPSLRGEREVTGKFEHTVGGGSRRVVVWEVRKKWNQPVASSKSWEFILIHLCDWFILQQTHGYVFYYFFSWFGRIFLTTAKVLSYRRVATTAGVLGRITQEMALFLLFQRHRWEKEKTGLEEEKIFTNHKSIPHDSSIAFLEEFIPRKMKTYIPTKTWTWVFTEALFVRARKWRQLRGLSVDEWINKTCSAHIMAQYPTTGSISEQIHGDRKHIVVVGGGRRGALGRWGNGDQFPDLYGMSFWGEGNVES